MSSRLQAWQRAIERAREGDLSGLVYLLCVPEQEIATVKTDAKGALIWRYTFAPLPNDPAVREAIVFELMRERPKSRGKAPRVNRAEAELIRSLHRLNRHNGMIDDASRDQLARFWKLPLGTLDDILRRRKTYADDYEARPKETLRLARNKAR